MYMYTRVCVCIYTHICKLFVSHLYIVRLNTYPEAAKPYIQKDVLLGKQHQFYCVLTDYRGNYIVIPR